LNRCRTSAALVAALASLVAVPCAGAATLSVDDDGVECPSAPYRSIQAAINAAATGDTVAICPGTYAEGSGAVATNALTIDKSLTLKGAGADLVTIKPVNAGGRIAEGGINIRNAFGDIVMARGLPSAPITVNISGVTVTGGGVVSEAGVVFLDAQGSLVRSRVTGITTTDDSTQAGGYRGTLPGYGVAQVTAATTAPAGVTPRPLLIDHTRVDGYNRVGVLIDSAITTADSGALTPSGVVNNLTMAGSQVVGHLLCTNYATDGNCASVNLISTGTLYGQDGVRVTGGATATVTNTLISQNLVNGVGAPARNAATNNANLTMGAGLRFVGAGASSVTRSNIVDNAYGVLNLAADQTTANTAVPVTATDNWWGLRYTSATNPGPAIAPTTNPQVPENPVNGTARPKGAGTTSDAVDFYPFRNGPQGSPDTGEYPLQIAPMAMADLAPGITAFSNAPGAYRPGDALTLKATASDDFGVTRIVFYEGATVVGTAAGASGSATLTVPAGACATRTYTAVAEDFLGQTGSSSIEVPGQCDDGGGAGGGGGGGGGAATTPEPAAGGTEASSAPAPTVALLSPPATIGAKGTSLSVAPQADAGVARVDFFLGTRLVCSSATAPYTCAITPTGADVGSQTLRVVVTDNAGGTGETATQVTVAKFAPASLALSTTEKRTSKTLSKRTITGTLKLPANVTAAQACASGTTTLVIKRGGKTLDDTQLKLDATCAFKRSLTALTKGKPFSVTAKFGGNAVLAPISNTRRFS
jgi:hypothetical protein